MRTDGEDRVGDAGRTKRPRPLLFVLVALGVTAGLAFALRELVVRAPTPGKAAVTLPQTAADVQPVRPATGSAPQAVAVPPQPATVTTMIEEPPLPALEASDPEVRASLADLLPPATQQALQAEQILRRFSALANSFAEGRIVRDKLPLPAIPGRLAVREDGERIFLADENFSRYDAVVDALAEADLEALGRWFVRYEPLMQQAWAELGNGDSTLRGALLAGIGHVLATPEPPAEIELVQPSVFYKYADPALEALPGSSRLLIRVGPRNRAILRARAERLRAILAGG